MFLYILIYLETPFGMKFLNVNSYRYGYQGEYAEEERRD